MVICTCVWSLLPARESQESSSRVIGHNSVWVWALVSFSPLSLQCQRLLLSPGLLQQPPDWCPSLRLCPTIYSQGSSLWSVSDSFLLCSEPSSGSRVKAQVLRVACEAPLSLLTRLPTFPDSLHCSCTGRLLISRGSCLRVFAGCSLCPAARPPALCKPPPSSSLGLCSNVTFPVRPSQTACFLSPGPAFSPLHSHVCLFSVCLHTSL